jgi:hypothetical protein
VLDHTAQNEAPVPNNSTVTAGGTTPCINIGTKCQWVVRFTFRLFILQHRSPSHLPVPVPSSQHPPSAPLRPTLAPKQRLTEWVQDALSPRAIRWDRRVKTTTRLHLMSSLRRRGAVPPLSHTPLYHAHRLPHLCVSHLDSHSFWRIEKYKLAVCTQTGHTRQQQQHLRTPQPYKGPV